MAIFSLLIFIAAGVAIVAIIPNDDAWPPFTADDSERFEHATMFWFSLMAAGLVVVRIRTTGQWHIAGELASGVGFWALITTIAAHARLKYWGWRGARDRRTSRRRVLSAVKQ